VINAKQLIEINNHKRTELLPENEKYYSNFLLYIRLQFFLSEQQSEEILMEILDHLIEGQNNGKTAQVIFGKDPKVFADEIIRQIPNENKNNMVRFISVIAFNLLGLFLIVRGIILFIVSFFKDVDILVYPYKSMVMFLVIICFCLMEVWIIFKIIKDSLFKENQNNMKDSLKAGISTMVLMGIILAGGYFLPNFGPSFPFTWYASFISGAVVWGITRFSKKYS
jgi:uncharacterized membrane-anchored protein